MSGGRVRGRVRAVSEAVSVLCPGAVSGLCPGPCPGCVRGPCPELCPELCDAARRGWRELERPGLSVNKVVFIYDESR